MVLVSVGESEREFKVLAWVGLVSDLLCRDVDSLNDEIVDGMSANI